MYKKCVIGAFFCAILSASAQMTNSIPQNLFLTDNGFLFWYRSGERLVKVSEIKNALNSAESRPADQDSGGHWGQATNGFQLSLRFEKSTFTNGESIVAVTLVRNVTNVNETYFFPVQIIAVKDGKILEQKNNQEIISITMPPMKTLFPQTQNRYQVNLSQEYNLTEAGKYEFQAVCDHPEILSKNVSIKIE
jgi:hypothetical protein